jgi:hypothetical protein
MNIEDILENSFDAFISEYELDPEGSINDMLFELFVAGFEAAIEGIDGDIEGIFGIAEGEDE